MPGLTNLVRRGATYYYRGRVPRDLVDHYRRSEFFVSLKTRDRHQAEHALAHLRARLVDDFNALRGVTQAAPALPRITGHATATPTQAKTSLWSLVDYWKAQSERRPRTVMEVETSFRRLIECGGDLSAEQFEKHHIVAFKDRMIEQGRSVATVKKAIALISAVFELAVANDKIGANPAKSVRLAKPKVERKSRVPFDADDLTRIFSSPVFASGLRPEGGKGEAAYWLPYLGLWTGARLEELGQLLVSDIRSEGDCYYINISDDPQSGKTLKSASSRRRVPVHPQLIRLGIIDYIEHQTAAGHVRLFPLLHHSGARQLTSNWSHWFSRYLRATVGIRDQRKVFHSFRHGFKEACRLSGIPKDIHDQLTGHTSRDVGDNYGGDHFPLPPLIQAMATLRIRGVI